MVMLARNTDPAYLHGHASDDIGCMLVVPSSSSDTTYFGLALDCRLAVQEPDI